MFLSRIIFCDLGNANRPRASISVNSKDQRMRNQSASTSADSSESCTTTLLDSNELPCH